MPGRHARGARRDLGAYLRLVLVHDPDTLLRLAMVRRLCSLGAPGVQRVQHATIATDAGMVQDARPILKRVQPRTTRGALIARANTTIQFKQNTTH